MRVGLLWRREWDDNTDIDTCRLRDVFRAFRESGVEAEPVVYSDDEGAELTTLDAVLVWVNPVEQGLDRSLLDPLLREAADRGTFVSAHPDVILKMGTKRVLWDTRELSWSTDTSLYETAAELRAGLPPRLDGGPLVLKQHRGMGGEGVWKVEAANGDQVVVQHASGDGAPRRMSLEAFLDSCAPYFDGAGLMVAQPYQPRLVDGMIRAYLTHDRVVGFTHQYPRGLMPAGPDTRPAGKVFEPPDEDRYAVLRARLESEWVPEMQRVLGLTTLELPVIWDADFLLGAGEESYVLCEINVSSTFAFPELAMPGVARATLARLRG